MRFGIEESDVLRLNYLTTEFVFSYNRLDGDGIMVIIRSLGSTYSMNLVGFKLN